MRARLLKFFEKLEPCLVGIESCETAYYWAREPIGLGHDVRLMPPSYVKPYVRCQRNGMADAVAMCEAVNRIAQSATAGFFDASVLVNRQNTTTVRDWRMADDQQVE